MRRSRLVLAAALLVPGCTAHLPPRAPEAGGVAWNLVLARPGADPVVTLTTPCLGGRPPRLRVAARRGAIDHLDRSLTGIAARADGHEVAVHRGAQGLFTVGATRCRALSVRYRLALPRAPFSGGAHPGPPPPGAGELSFLSRRGGFLLGQATLLAPAVAPVGPVHLGTRLPRGWRAVGPWARDRGGFVAPDVRSLVDAYLVLGPMKVKRIRVGRSAATLVFPVQGDPTADARFAATLAKVVKAALALFHAGAIHVLVAIKDDLAPGGFEGTVDGRAVELDLPRTRGPGLEGAALFLAAHDLGHTWTCAAAPANGPGRLEWFHEGFTDYLSWLALRRAGALDARGLLARVAKALGQAVAIDRAGGGVTLLAASQRFLSDPTTRRLAYAGGALVAFALDRRLEAEGGGRSLVGLLRRFRNRWCPAHHTFTLEDLLGVIGAYGGQPVAAMVRRAISTPGFPDPKALLAGTGCTATATETRSPRLGMGLRIPPGGPATVAAVVPGGAAAAAGLEVGDVLVAIGGRPIATPKALQAATAGALATLRVRYRRGGRSATATLHPSVQVTRHWHLACPGAIPHRAGATPGATR